MWKYLLDKKAKTFWCWVLYTHCPRPRGIISIPSKHKWGRVMSSTRLGHTRAEMAGGKCQGQGQALGWGWEINMFLQFSRQKWESCGVSTWGHDRAQGVFIWDVQNRVEDLKLIKKHLCWSFFNAQVLWAGLWLSLRSSDFSRSVFATLFSSTARLGLERNEGANLLWLWRNNLKVKFQLGAGQGSTHCTADWSVSKLPTIKGWWAKKPLEIEAYVTVIRMHKRENCIRTCTISCIALELDSLPEGGI